MARMISDRAHRTGLAAAQKNAGELGDLGRLLGGLDFAVVELCRQFDECDGYMAVYGDRVFAIEYPAADARSLRRGLRGARRPHRRSCCATATSTMPGDPAYRFDSC